MAIAAFILSILAIGIATASAWYTRRQAISTEGVQRTEAARRHDELQPVLIGEYVQASDTRDGQRPWVKLTNRGPLDLDRVEVQAIPAHRADEAAIEGIYDHGTGETATVHESGPIRRGEPWTFDVIPARDLVDGVNLERGGTASFRCACHAAGNEPWVVIVSVDFPATPRIH